MAAPHNEEPLIIPPSSNLMEDIYIFAMLFDFNNCYCLEIKIAKILIAIWREKNSFIFLLTLLGLSCVSNRLIAARQLSTQGG